MSSEEDEDKPSSTIASLPENLLSYYSQMSAVFDEIKEKSSEEVAKMCGVDDMARLKFVEFVMKFGISPLRIEDVYKA